MTKTAVVILNYNGEKLLPQFLPSVIQYSGDAVIIVADNGSTDGSVALLKRDFSQVKLIELKENSGFCGGYNRALSQVEAGYYVLLNSDVEVTPGWLDPLVAMLDRNEQVAAVQPKILSYRQRERFEYAGAAVGFIDALGYPFCRGRIFDHLEEDRGQYDDEREIFWATGACFIIRSAIFHRFGGFDEDMFAHMEEIDLCWKINRAGFKVCYSGKSTVYHLGAGTLEYNNPRKVFLNFRNGLILLYKHLSKGELAFKMPLRFVLDWMAALFFLVKGKARQSQMIFRAHRDFLRNLGKHRAKRRAILRAYPQYPTQNIHPGMIIFDYYLRKKKVFKG